MSVFMIIGRSDPIFEAEFSSPAASSSSGKSVQDPITHFPSNTFLVITTDSSSQNSSSYLSQFIIHSSLDMIDSAIWTNRYYQLLLSPFTSLTLHLNSSTFLRVVDRFNTSLVSAYLTPGGAILVLLHDGKQEDNIKVFFTEVHELYARHIMNPFATVDGPIISTYFDGKVRALARKILQL